MMRNALLTLGTLLSVIFLPWVCTALLAIVSALSLPLLPLAAGILFDVLYWTPRASFPIASVLGAVVSAAAFLVRMRFRAGIIGR